MLLSWRQSWGKKPCLFNSIDLFWAHILTSTQSLPKHGTVSCSCSDSKDLPGLMAWPALRICQIPAVLIPPASGAGVSSRSHTTMLCIWPCLGEGSPGREWTHRCPVLCEGSQSCLVMGQGYRSPPILGTRVHKFQRAVSWDQGHFVLCVHPVTVMVRMHLFWFALTFSQ